MARISTAILKEKRLKHEKITMLTAYDYSLAAMVDAAGIDMILVGDSLGMVVLGYENTLAVTMDDMIHHTKAVVRGSKNAMVVGDMPFLSYHVSVKEAVRNAGRFIQEAGAQAIKLEGGVERIDTVKAILDAQIPVMAHIGLTPQSVNQFGGFKVQGKDLETANKLIRDAKALEEAGVFPWFWKEFPPYWPKKLPKKYPYQPLASAEGITVMDRC
jgi:3-methyl-2-oxobutanoate hydroxymethyltransferase